MRSVRHAVGGGTRARPVSAHWGEPAVWAMGGLFRAVVGLALVTAARGERVCALFGGCAAAGSLSPTLSAAGVLRLYSPDLLSLCSLGLWLGGVAFGASSGPVDVCSASTLLSPSV